MDSKIHKSKQISKAIDMAIHYVYQFNSKKVLDSPTIQKI